MKKAFNIILTTLIALTSVYVFGNCDVSSADSDRRIIVSLGDSYSAGEGIPDFYGQKDSEGNNKPMSEKIKNNDWLAHRSTKAWPGLLELDGIIMNQHKDENWYFAAVSGATTENLYNIQKKQYVYRKSLYDLCVGSEPLPPQLEIFDKVKNDGGTVDYVTLTMGGNDLGFTDIVTDEVINSLLDRGINTLDSNIKTVNTAKFPFLFLLCGKVNCTLNVNKVTETLNKRYICFDECYERNDSNKGLGVGCDLKNAYKNIQNKAGEQAKIIVAGYPRILEEDWCGVWFTNEAREQVNKYTSLFNNKIREVVEDCRKNDNLNTFFVSVEEEFSDKKNEKINRIQFPKSEDLYHAMFYNDEDKINFQTPVSAYSIHPNEHGADAYKSAVQNILKDLDDTGIISGRVYDREKNPAKRVDSIVFKHILNGEEYEADYDSETGYYEVLCKPGMYSVSVNKNIIIHDIRIGEILENNYSEKDHIANVESKLRVFKRNIDINLDDECFMTEISLLVLDENGDMVKPDIIKNNNEVIPGTYYDTVNVLLLPDGDNQLTVLKKGYNVENIAITPRKSDYVVKLKKKIDTDYETVEFGGYRWRVLEKNENAMLVIAENIEELRKFDNRGLGDITWENCTLREYLNNSFYNSFSTEDKARIVETYVANDDNPKYGTEGGKPTKDKIFILSAEEVIRYFGSDADSRAVLSENAVQKFLDRNGSSGEWIKKWIGINRYWRLRTAGSDINLAANVDCYGGIDYDGNEVTSIDGGIRPALYLKY